MNASELLRLYLCHGYLEDAATLASEYISAVMGLGKEYFGLHEALNAKSAPVWLPYNALDQLLLELRDHSDDPVYKAVSDFCRVGISRAAVCVVNLFCHFYYVRTVDTA